jgi:hypothetical protein
LNNDVIQNTTSLAGWPEGRKQRLHNHVTSGYVQVSRTPE